MKYTDRSHCHAGSSGQLNVTRAAVNKAPIKIRVGMPIGPLIMGITGDHDRVDATTISDTVNTAYRLESLTKHYQVNIVLSEASVKNLPIPKDFHIRHLGNVQLKGKLEPISIYACFNGSDENNMSKKLTALPIFNQGMSHYFNKSFDEASDKFKRVLEIYPSDTTAKTFLGKATDHINTGIAEDWTGVEEMRNK